VKAVEQMRDAAIDRDQMAPLLRSRDLAADSAPSSLSQYFHSNASLDFQLLNITGNATQQRFIQVQERLGFFANRCPFSPPPRRKA